jgi:hypothetical protein
VLAPVAGMLPLGLAEHDQARHERCAVRFELVIAPAEIRARRDFLGYCGHPSTGHRAIDINGAGGCAVSGGDSADDSGQFKALVAINVTSRLAAAA